MAGGFGRAATRPIPDEVPALASLASVEELARAWRDRWHATGRDLFEADDACAIVAALHHVERVGADASELTDVPTIGVERLACLRALVGALIASECGAEAGDVARQRDAALDAGVRAGRGRRGAHLAAES